MLNQERHPIGVRDGFLTFFAEDAVSLNAGADGTKATIAKARDELRGLASPQLPLANRLIWEPFTGHVSSDGTMGWLTGGSVTMALSARTILRQGAYFSVWRRQSDGTWKVWLDEGLSLPQVWQDASPFRVAPEVDAGTVGETNETIETVERAVAAGGKAWTDRLATGVRYHRNARMPMAGRAAVLEWASTGLNGVKYTVIRTEVAGSNDLAVTLGGYDAPGEHGTWVRMWKRDVTGRWRLVFETSKAAT
jgi:hypothetical protein